MIDTLRIAGAVVMLGVATTAMPVSRAVAHHGPEHVIAELSAKIRSTNIVADAGNATLYVRRADEWRVLGKRANAVVDYNLALKCDPYNRLAHYGLARTQIDMKLFRSASATARQGIDLAGDRELRAPFFALLALANAGNGDNQAALEAWSKALNCELPEVDWLIQHALVLQRLDRHKDARDSLAKAIKRNPSTVLYRAWVDTLIVCGDVEEATRHIENGLSRSRWKSSWLLQRAKLHQACNEAMLAKRDIQAALKEIESRTVKTITNPVLETQRALANQLLQSIDSKTLPGESFGHVKHLAKFRHHYLQLSFCRFQSGDFLLQM